MLIPNGPHHQHGDRSHCSSVSDAHVARARLPRPNGVEQVPCGRVHVLDAEFQDHHVPKFEGEAASEEKTGTAFLHSSAQGARATVWPTSLI